MFPNRLRITRNLRGDFAAHIMVMSGSRINSTKGQILGQNKKSPEKPGFCELVTIHFL